ncbi:glycosyltransferase [Marinobacter salicampi]|uniref:glycosyltransferase n=1 Tax=Marinobacter salicampi TaxID=435907 RepID=UPI00140B5984|nr:glycosyltransferase [Marinobacter salicampi]
MKLAIVCLIPDFGHLIPLIRIAKEAIKDGHEIRFFVPDEAEPIINKKEFCSYFFGSVTPEHGQKSLRRLFDAPPLANRLILRYLFDYDYLVPLKINVLSRLDEVRSAVKFFGPDLVIGDATLSFKEAMYTIAADCGVPVVLHHAPGTNQRPRRIRVAGKRYSIRKLVYDFCSNILISVESRSTRLFAKAEWERRKERSLIVEGYKAQFAQLKESRPGTKLLYITTGLAALETKYLGNLIEVPPDRILLGPLPPVSDSEISSELNSWLELAGGRPVIFVCFGTLASFSRKAIDAIVEAATELDVRLLWASKNNPLQDVRLSSSDIRWEPWLPQPAILSHPAVRGFLSHAGGSSIQEALWFAQPLICVPQMWDQPYNGWVTEKLGFGVTIDKTAFTKERLVYALQKVIYSDELRQNVTNLSAEVRAQNGSGRIRALIREIGGSAKKIIEPTL